MPGHLCCDGWEGQTSQAWPSAWCLSLLRRWWRACTTADDDLFRRLHTLFWKSQLISQFHDGMMSFDCGASNENKGQQQVDMCLLKVMVPKHDSSPQACSEPPFRTTTNVVRRSMQWPDTVTVFDTASSAAKCARVGTPVGNISSVDFGSISKSQLRKTILRWSRLKLDGIG